MLRRLALTTLFSLFVLAGCAQLSRFLARTGACVANGPLENWLGSRLGESDWPAMSGGARAGGTLGSIISCGLEGLADALTQADGSSDPSVLRRVRAERCRTGECASVRERAAAILERVAPTPTVVSCRAADSRAVMWLRDALPRHPKLADDILRMPYGAELELSLYEVANSSAEQDPATAAARTALRRSRTRRCVGQ